VDRDQWCIKHFHLCDILTVDCESLLNDLANLFFRPRLHIEAALDFDQHRVGVQFGTVGVVPG